MSTLSTLLASTTNWNDVCYPVYGESLIDQLRDGYALTARDRSQLIIAEREGRKNILAIQSAGYSIVPNELIRQVVESCFVDYSVDIKHSHTGEFTFMIIMPEGVKIGSEFLQRSIIINNSYNGKTNFTVQGRSVQKETETGVQVSFYRQICTNGLFGWIDEWMNLDEYAAWLVNPRKQKHPSEKQKVGAVGTRIVEKKREQKVLQKQAHYAVDLEVLARQLKETIQEFSGITRSLTPIVYEAMNNTKLTSPEAEKIIRAEIPKSLVKSAIERMNFEERALSEVPNLWLTYNAINFALFNTKSSMTIADRYRQDEAAFHGIAKLVLA